jgi:hypothetical protein
MKKENKEKKISKEKVRKQTRGEENKMEHVKNEFVIRARHMYEPLSLTHSI